ncbi:MAG: DUF853 family protein [Rhodospirillaceae bacterium]|nr:DUF853 family protein [Rhodospirillaceae bacterium]
MGGQADAGILIGRGAWEQRLPLATANRHGLIAGATGTGKTVTLQVLAEGFSRAGVPVFMADVKGDLSGISQPGRPHAKVDERVARIGIADHAFEGCPTIFWDLFGQQGHPIRTTVSEMGPLLLANLLQLNETQEGVLNVVFEVADDEGLLLLDLKDLRSLLTFAAENARDLSARYGRVALGSVGAIQRQLLMLDQQGGDRFFGEPALDLADLMRTAPDGRGVVNVLAADRLMQSPRLYATLLLWLLAELFEELPEVGDPDKPVLVFFFDEAHLLFDHAPRALMEQVEQVVRLIRSKGVGVYFVTQNPLDIPAEIAGQLGHRVQHALRAFTLRERKAVQAVAESFRINPALDVAAAITELGVGEALVSTLDGEGIPGVVDRTLVCPPRSRIGPADAQERQRELAADPVGPRYDTGVDRQSAYEELQRRAERPRRSARDEAERGAGRQRENRESPRSRRAGRQAVGEAFASSMARAVGSQLGRSLTRGLLGSLFR